MKAENKKNRRIIVHFGTHKTGTSSIQDTMFNNCHILKDIHYLSFNGRANSSLIVKSAFMKVENLLSLPGRTQPKIKVVENRKRQKKRISKELSSITAYTTILSAEAISQFDYDELRCKS